MSRNRVGIISAIALGLASLLMSPIVMADKPLHAQGRDRSERNAEHRNDHGSRSSRDGSHFSDDHRHIIHGYYEPRFTRGKCPPGLAKKHNGCMPPGLTRQWMLGRPLPSDLIYYSLPHELIVRLPPPPPHHRYIRVASDILLIAIGTGLVIDAIEDIGR